MKIEDSEGLMNSTGAERNKGKIRRIENRRMSHPIAPKGHQKQGDNENAPKGYRIVLFYRNRKGRSFDCSATDAQRSSTSGPGQFCSRKRERFLRSITPPPFFNRFLRSSGRSLLSFRSVCFCYYCSWKAFKCEEHALLLNVTKGEQNTKLWVRGELRGKEECVMRVFKANRCEEANKNNVGIQKTMLAYR